MRTLQNKCSQTLVFLLFYLVVCCHNLHAQAAPTIGLISNTAQAFNGYTLFAPSNYTVTYLIDNCGRTVKTWQSPYAGAGGVYLLTNGNLLRTVHVPANQTFSGAAGRIEEYDWDGNLLWGYTFAGATFNQHHDAIKLPNGNIALLSWYLRTRDEAIAAGRKTSLSPMNGLWSEKIVELKPIGKDSAIIIWEWRAWDHLVQDNDASKVNFGVVREHPERLDINYLNKTTATNDWIHFNGLAYNAELDQIIVSSRELSEIYIIDHSTTTAEAASSKGGRQGKGGDFLWRWGNPQAYQRGTSADRTLFGQHNPQWIANSSSSSGNILVFNNGDERPDGAYSTIEELQTPVSASGAYTLPVSTTATFAPSGSVWTYKAIPATSFFSNFISGAQRLPNRNTLICEGLKGNFFEVTPTGAIVWQYRNPVGTSGPTAQGSTVMGQNVFRCVRYAPDYGAFRGRALTSGLPIELNPVANNCTTTTDIHSAIPLKQDFNVFPNPASDLVHIQLALSKTEHISLKIFNTLGQELAHVLDSELSAGEHVYQVSLQNSALNISSGVIFVQFSTSYSTLKTLPIKILH